jgi:hypothetical protein
MDTHENAANAIVHLQNININGSIAKVKRRVKKGARSRAKKGIIIVMN